MAIVQRLSSFFKKIGFMAEYGCNGLKMASVYVILRTFLHPVLVLLSTSLWFLGQAVVTESEIINSARRGTRGLACSLNVNQSAGSSGAEEGGGAAMVKRFLHLWPPLIMERFAWLCDPESCATRSVNCSHILTGSNCFLRESQTDTVIHGKSVFMNGRR